MRTEIKAAIAVGLVVFVGAIIWAVNSSEKADKIPFDLPPGQTSGEDVALVGDERVVPGETTLAQQEPATLGRPEEPSLLSYEPIQPRPDVSKPGEVVTGPGMEEPLAASEIADRPGSLVAASAPATEPPAPDQAQRPPTSPKEDVASRLEGLKRPATGSKYTIQPGDTFIAIAREHYGEDRYWTAIQAANPDVDPRSLQPGQVIVLPPKEQVVAGEVKRVKEKKDADRATYVVAEGDTLIAIARNVLKDESRYLEIFELNRDKLESPDALIPGTELRLPPLEKKPAKKKEE
ncbi:MAG TPA: LysM peptidoglycan-binding domain-containing protein [Phycisphaerae bacterium]|nr:LysM peptidoglycan-binding domain-containing protein [Phycisphaerae bacterium]